MSGYLYLWLVRWPWNPHLNWI